MHIIRFRCQKDGTYYWLYLWMNKKLSVATVGALLCWGSTASELAGNQIGQSWRELHLLQKYFVLSKKITSLLKFSGTNPPQRAGIFPSLIYFFPSLPGEIQRHKGQGMFWSGIECLASHFSHMAPLPWYIIVHTEESRRNSPSPRTRPPQPTGQLQLQLHLSILQIKRAHLALCRQRSKKYLEQEQRICLCWLF
jgi:hypothetical protein